MGNTYDSRVHVSGGERLGEERAEGGLPGGRVPVSDPEAIDPYRSSVIRTRIDEIYEIVH